MRVGIKMIKVRNISDVVEWQLCTGCGMCAAMEPDRFSMTEVFRSGLRPTLKADAKPETGVAFKHCPGHQLKHTFDRQDERIDKSLVAGWGPVLGVWEGHAVDEEVRFKGSSGGAATALALFGIERKGAEKVLHIASKSETPFRNEAVFSFSRNELLRRSGSRYAPASPCEKIGELKESASKTIFIGKPCDIAAASSWESDSSSNELAIKIGFFCAGTPSTQANIDLIERENVSRENLISLKYRGEGWPGVWRAKDAMGKTSELTYAESWGFLQRFRQWRCYICPDHTAEFADIAVGDPWYREIQATELGSSLIIARTQKGLDYIRAAESAGYIKLLQQNPALLPLSQPKLLRSRGMLWARLVVLRVFGAAAPVYIGFSLLPFWISELSFKEKVKSFGGTIKRVYRKSLNKRVSVPAA